MHFTLQFRDYRHPLLLWNTPQTFSILSVTGFEIPLLQWHSLCLHSEEFTLLGKLLVLVTLLWGPNSSHINLTWSANTIPIQKLGRQTYFNFLIHWTTLTFVLLLILHHQTTTLFLFFLGIIRNDKTLCTNWLWWFIVEESWRRLLKQWAFLYLLTFLSLFPS